MNAGGAFLHPEAWPLLLLVPAAAALVRLLAHSRSRRTDRILGPRRRALAPDPTRRRVRVRFALRTAALALALAAVLQPMWGEGIRDVEQRGVDVLICLDVSRSMLARDVAPSRLERAKAEIRALAKAVEADRLGLVVFAGEARLASPLTRDRRSFSDLVDLADPLDVTRGGTDLGAALTAALAALEDATGDHEAVLLLTDGEDLGERGAGVARECRERGIRVHTVGIGSDRGAKITLPGDGGESFLTDRAGRDVVSALDRNGLRRIADITGGVFVEASGDVDTLVGLHEARIAPMARKVFETERNRERENRFQWLLLPAIVLWLLAIGLPDRSRAKLRRDRGGRE